ncbi:MAG: EAL domain-containing protein, partial [bacterium]
EESVINDKRELKEQEKDQTGLRKIRLESDLKNALEKGELQVVYQPMLNLKQGKITGFEALARWTHAERGLISPMEFIALAEETDLIVPVGLHILEVAAKQLAKFQPIVNYPLFMSINVSPRQMKDRGFLKFAAALVNLAGLNPDQIKLEVTETLASDLDFLSNWIDRAHKLGFRVALDDFGTGYTSLEYLSRLEANSIKIDQAFIRPLFNHDKHALMLKHIVGLLRDLGFEVIAEGVETDRHIKHLAELGVHLAQGYGISRPISTDKIMEFLKQQ